MREHYELTCRRWYESLLSHQAEAQQIARIVRDALPGGDDAYAVLEAMPAATTADAAAHFPNGALLGRCRHPDRQRRRPWDESGRSPRCRSVGTSPTAVAARSTPPTRPNSGTSSSSGETVPVWHPASIRGPKDAA
jgi:hypothetical protein